MLLSTSATCSIEEVACAAPDCLKWFQLYPFRNPKHTRTIVQRAEENGFKAIVLTVDLNTFGIRYKDKRNHFKLPSHLSLRNLEGFTDGNHEATTGPYEAAKLVLDSNLSWSTVDLLKSITRLPIVLKGILTAEDAQLAVEHGASAVVVSNHGGRQLDGVLATVSIN